MNFIFLILILLIDNEIINFLFKLILLSINLIVLLINIYYLLFYNFSNPLFYIRLKNSDNFTFFISSEQYMKIYKNEIFNNNKTIKILFNCVDTHNYTISNDLLKIWFQEYNNFILEVNTENPDFLIYDIWGSENLNPKYNNSVKIAYYTENFMPDLNHADYALSQAHIMYLDRYLKFPDFIWVLNKVNNYNLLKIREESIRKNNKKFCAAVISSNFTSEYFRFDFINKLKKYKKIDMGGRAFNNVGGRVKDKINFLSSYKFSFAMENTKGDGYVSEKIIDSFLAGTIPIYYGDYMVDEYINPRSFILQNIMSKKSVGKKILNYNFFY